MKGKLFIVPTPIGNLGDITIRALETLKKADVVLAEDTRNSGVLFRKYKINTPTRSFHAFNEHQKVERIVDEIASGTSMAIVSDAGTPGISDAGYLLIHKALASAVRVEALPGATALIPALLKSGFPSEKFIFEGFLPHKKGRQARLKTLAEEARTVIMYESPHRVIKTLNQISDYFGSTREISVSRELTKKFEETINGTAGELVEHFDNTQPKGEFVIVIKGKV